MVTTRRGARVGMVSSDESHGTTLGTSPPLFEVLDTRKLVFFLALAVQAVSLWFISAGTVRISSFPADSLYYARQLPFAYWWGVAASLALLISASTLRGRLRVTVELSSLLLLALYVIGLPSFVYENPRILDSYAHMSNSLLILASQGWVGSTDWYVRQFPGAYIYFAQLIAIAGISPFDLMKYYVIGCSWVMILFLYTISRWFNPSYAARVAALSIGGFWFQLHLCPQSLELIPFLGFIFIFVKIAVDKKRQNLWTILAISTIPVFVVSHPETGAVVLLGLGGLIFLSRAVPFLAWLRARTRLPGLGILSRILPDGQTMDGSTLRKYELFLMVLLVAMLSWWYTFADEARVEILGIAQRALASAFSGRTAPPATLPTTPAYSYELAIALEQAVSVTIWLLGLSFFLLSRGKMKTRDYAVWGLFLAAVSTIPLTFQVRADMLQRSYLFSLLPGTLLFGALMRERSLFKIKGHSLHASFKVVLILAIIVFAVLMPLTRNGVDPYEYIPSSSLFVSNVAAGLSGHSSSVLFLYNGEYGWRYYAALSGDQNAIRDEPRNMAEIVGGFTKPNSTVTVAGQIYIIPFTPADRSSHYIVVSSFYENLYVLRFGQGSAYYVDQKNSFESQVSGPAGRFDLVYSTGTDRIYANVDPQAPN